MLSYFSSLVSEDIDGQPIKMEKEPAKPKFAASKWETVDDEVVKAQGLFPPSYVSSETHRATHPALLSDY